MKHIVFKSFGSIIMTIALAIACTKASQSGYGDSDNTFLPMSDVKAHSTGETFTFSYLADYDWNVAVRYSGEEEKWIIATKMTSDVKVEVSPFSKDNKNNNNQRTATVVLRSSSGKELDSFKITQDRFIFEIDETNKPETYPAWIDQDCEPIVLTITKGAEAVPSLDWIDLKPLTSNGANETERYAILPKHNSGIHPRTVSDMTISCKATGDVLGNISISQLGFEFDVSPDKLDTFNEIPKDSDKRSLKVTCSGEWEVEAPDWIIITDHNGSQVKEGKGNADIYVNADVNGSKVTKNGTVIFGVKNIQKLSRSISVDQNKYIWTVEGASGLVYNVGPIPGSDGNKSFNVTSSGLWKTSYNSSELEVNPSQADSVTSSPQKVTVTVNPNYTKSPRIIKLAFVSDDYDKTISDEDIDLADTVKFEQSAYLFTISDADLKTPLGAAVNSTRTIPVTCPGKLQSASVEESAKAWLEAKVDGQNVILTAKQANATGKDRSAKVTITSEHTQHNSELKEVLTVTQSK